MASLYLQKMCVCVCVYVCVCVCGVCVCVDGGLTDKSSNSEEVPTHFSKIQKFSKDLQRFVARQQVPTHKLKTFLGHVELSHLKKDILILIVKTELYSG